MENYGRYSLSPTAIGNLCVCANQSPPTICGCVAARNSHSPKLGWRSGGGERWVSRKAGTVQQIPRRSLDRSFPTIPKNQGRKLDRRQLYRPRRNFSPFWKTSKVLVEKNNGRWTLPGCSTFLRQNPGKRQLSPGNIFATFNDSHFTVLTNNLKVKVWRGLLLNYLPIILRIIQSFYGE